MSSSPYEILGVPASASTDDLRRAFRRALRETHPDTGGDPQRFTAVQRAWELIGTPEARAAYDAGRLRGPDDEPFRARTTAPRRDSRPTTRSYGHPGGWRRETYLEAIREWVGRGVTVDDPYDPALVRSAPREIRRTLADALAEEATARTLSTLGIGFTVWHDVSTGAAERKIDHVVLGPTGLFALLSEDFGGEIRTKRGELIGDAVGPEKPVDALVARSKSLARSARVRFTALGIVVPDDALAERMTVLGQARGATTFVVRQEGLGSLLRGGLPGGEPMGGNELFDVRTRLQSTITFVA